MNECVHEELSCSVHISKCYVVARPCTFIHASSIPEFSREIPSGLIAAIKVCNSPSLGTTVLLRSSRESIIYTAFSCKVMSTVITVGIFHQRQNSSTAELVESQSVMYTNHVLLLTTVGRHPTWIKVWLAGTSDLNPAQPGILLCSPCVRTNRWQHK